MTTPIQTYYVPLRENDLVLDFELVNSVTDDPINTLISIAVAAPDTVIWYDHWEDGYDTDYVNAPGTTTQVWGDGNAANGIAPGFGTDSFSGGEAIVLENQVDLDTIGTTLSFDGGDRIVVSFPVAVTRAAYPVNPGSVLAGAVEVFATNSLGTAFTVPVGEDTGGSTDPFETTSVHIMASAPGTEVFLNAVSQGTIANAGQTLRLTDLNEGDEITTSKPAQASLVTGNVDSSYQMRWYALSPIDQWSDDYISPVAEEFMSTGFWFYNPNGAAITIGYGFEGTPSAGSFTVPAGETAFIEVDNETGSINVPGTVSGIRFTSTGGENFFALSQSDADGSGNTYDWGHPLVAVEDLTSQAIVGLGYGNTSNSSTIESRSVVWVTPVEDAIINVDFDGDGVVDYSQTMNALEGLRIVDDTDEFTGAQNDQDMSGAFIFATNLAGTAPVDIAVAWGQDGSRSLPESQSLDVGTVVPPLPELTAGKTVTVLNDLNSDGQAGPGDTLEWVINITNFGFSDIDAGDYTIVDALPAFLANIFAVSDYVADSTTYTYVTDGGVTMTDPVTDNGSGTAFPLDGSGFTNTDKIAGREGNEPGETQLLKFQTAVKDFADLPGGTVDANNIGSLRFDGDDIIQFNATIPIVYDSGIQIEKTTNGVQADTGTGPIIGVGEAVTWTYTVTNTGNTILDNVSVTDDQSVTPIYQSGDDGDWRLEPGEIWIYEASGIAIEGQYNNIGQASGKAIYADGSDVPTVAGGGTVTDTDPSAYFGGNPGLLIEKSITGMDVAGDGSLNTAGDVIDYKIVVTNTGNVTLTDVTIDDPLLGGVLTTLTSLDVGAMHTETASYTITQDDLDTNGGGDGLIENMATADSNETGPDDDEASAPLDYDPGLSIEKTITGVDTAGDGELNTAGEVIDYKIVVTNTGNVTLTDVTIVDPLLGGVLTTLPTLAVGTMHTETASYTITQDDLDTNGGGDGLIENTATADSNETDAVDDDANAPLAQTPGLLIEKSITGVDTAGDGSLNKAGDVIDYKIVVTNTGNVTLSDVTIEDPLLGGLLATLPSLGAGDMHTETGSYTITQDDLDTNGGGDGLIENMATADSNETGPDDDEASAPLDYDPGLSIEKTITGVDTAGDGELNTAGEVIDYKIVVTNTGNVTLTDVTIDDPLLGGVLTTLPTLAVGDMHTETASYTITQDDLDTNGGGDGLIDNTATADSDETGPDDDDADAPVDYDPGLAIEKTVIGVDVAGDGELDEAGDLIDYQIVVTNTGNVTLTNVTIDDPLLGGALTTLTTLDVGAMHTETASYAITQEDLDTNGGGDGLIDNTATADSDQTNPVEDDADEPVDLGPGLLIEKSITGMDVAGDGSLNKAGDVIDYKIVVTNTGNVTLTDVTIDDPLLGGVLTTLTSLDVGAMHTETASYTITQDDLDTNGGGDGVIENTATADSNETGPDDDEASAPLDYDPGLAIEKTITGVDTAGDGELNTAGEVIDYKIVVTNTGNVTLTDVTIVDPLLGGTLDTLPTLAAGTMHTETASYTITQDDLDTNGGGDGLIENTATADSNETDAVDDDANAPLAQTPGLLIEKSITGVDTAGDGSLNKAGDVIDYKIVVTNTGNVTLSDVTIEDPLLGGLLATLPSLGAGDMHTETGSYTITQDDLDTNGGGDGLIENMATADSNETGPDDDEASAPLDYDPGLSIEKTITGVDTAGDGELNTAGEVIDYKIVVTNTGNVTLTDVTIVDPLLGGVLTTLPTLAVGGMHTETASYTITQDDLDTNGGGDGLIENTATADSDETDPDDDDADAPVDRTAGLAIVKSVLDVDGEGADGEADEAGDIITYEIVTSNTGNVTLTDVTVADPLTGLDVTIGDLGVGESDTRTATYTVTQDDLDTNGAGDGDIDNTATADSDETNPVSDDEDVPVDYDPGLAIVKSVLDVDGEGAGGVADEAGDIITYEIVTSNTGNVTLTNVTVMDPLTGLNINIGDLGVGESDTRTATYTVTQDDLDTNGGVDVSAGVLGTVPFTGSDSADLRLTSLGRISEDGEEFTAWRVRNTTDDDKDVRLESVGGAFDLVFTVPANSEAVVLSDAASGAATHRLFMGDDLIDTKAAGNQPFSANGFPDGDIDNTATADSDQTGPVEDDADAPVDQVPGLSLSKTVLDVDGEGADGVAEDEGDIITYQLITSNTGNVTLTNVAVVDPLTGLDVTIGDLGVGETDVQTVTYTVTRADLISDGDGDGDIDNTATADSDQTGPVTDDADAPVEQVPELSIDKIVLDVDGEGASAAADEAGDVITYRIVTTNTGTQALTGVTVQDPLTGLDIVVGDLAADESDIQTVTYTVTQADLNADGGGDGDIDNTATADSDQTGPVSDDEDVPLVYDPALGIDKTVLDVGGDGAKGAIDEIGDVITYQIVVTNTGNVDLTDVTVIDPLTGLDVLIGDLGVGESDTRVETYTVRGADLTYNAILEPDDVNPGYLDNTATADSNETGPVHDTESVAVLQDDCPPEQRTAYRDPNPAFIEIGNMELLPEGLKIDFNQGPNIILAENLLPGFEESWMADNASRQDVREYLESQGVYALDGDDNLNGSGQGEYFEAGSGHDTVHGNGGNDLLFGQLGDDFLTGGEGDDLLSGGHGNDQIEGGSGNDIVAGGCGDDIMQGEDGDDILIGGIDFGYVLRDGDNLQIRNGDLINGNAGADRFLYEQGDGVDLIRDFKGFEGDIVEIYGYTADDVEIVKNTLGSGHQKDGLILGDDEGAIFFEDVLDIEQAIADGDIVFKPLGDSPIEELTFFTENPAEYFGLI